MFKFLMAASVALPFILAIPSYDAGFAIAAGPSASSPDASFGFAEGPEATALVVATDVITDCNGNGYDDLEDIILGRSKDVNGNNVPDECEPGWKPPVSASNVVGGGFGPHGALLWRLANELLIFEETGTLESVVAQDGILDGMWQDDLATYYAVLQVSVDHEGSYRLMGTVESIGWTGAFEGPVVVNAVVHLQP